MKDMLTLIIHGVINMVQCQVVLVNSKTNDK